MLIIKPHMRQIKLSSFDQRNQNQKAKILSYRILVFNKLSHLHSQLHQDLLTSQKILLLRVSIEVQRTMRSLLEKIVNIY